MSESFEVTSQPSAEVRAGDLQAQAAGPHAVGSAANVAGCAAGRAHQPLTLAAVLHHVLLIENPVRPSSTSRQRGWDDEPVLRRVNQVLYAVLDACLKLDAVRQQLQGAIATQHEIELVLELLAVRVELRQATQLDHRQVTNRLNHARDTVSETVAEWNRVGRHFTQLTRLLPVQLAAGFEALAPVLTDEMDRLAQACLATSADVDFSLSQRAQAWAARRTDAPGERGVVPEDFDAWVSNLEEARMQAAADFASAREAYLQAVLDFDREHANLVRARSLRRTAETGFRSNTRGAPEFAEAILNESRRNHAVLRCRAQRRAAQYQLYALAGLLPRQFGLIGPAAGY